MREVELDEFNIVFYHGDYKIVWEWIGEGNSGDYNFLDPEDKRRLRFTVYLYQGPIAEEVWYQLENASYCTLMTPNTPFEYLELYAMNILDAVYGTDNYKRKLEIMTWATEEELKAALERSKENE